MYRATRVSVWISNVDDRMLTEARLRVVLKDCREGFDDKIHHIIEVLPGMGVFEDLSRFFVKANFFHASLSGNFQSPIHLRDLGNLL